jgi:hypothetical protein
MKYIYLLSDTPITVRRRLSAELNLEDLLRGNRERFLNLASANPQIIDCVSGDTLTFAFSQPDYSFHISLEKSSFISKLRFFVKIFFYSKTSFFASFSQLCSSELPATLVRRFYTESCL